MKNLMLAGLALLIFACSSEKKNEQVLFDEVIAIHDDVMPEMGTLHSLSGKLRQTADSLIQIDSVSKAKDYNELSEMSLLVDLANESMMEWMRKFEQPSDEMPHEEVMRYLQEQKMSISEVRDNMVEAKKKAEEMLSNY